MVLGVDVPDGWEITPVYRRGEMAGFFCVQGNEIHAHRAEEYRGHWLTRQDLERLTRPLFAEYGVIRTKVRTENAEGHEFVSRLGFTKTGERDGLTYYKAERLRHARF